MPYANVEFRRAYDRARNRKRKPHTLVPKTLRRERTYLTPLTHKTIKRLRKAGVAMSEIAAMFGVSYWTVRDIVKKRRGVRKTGQAQYACKSRDGEFVRHLYKLVIDSDGNYRCCLRCRKVSFRLAAGEGGRVRMRG
jgi:hypothetical protein